MKHAIQQIAALLPKYKDALYNLPADMQSKVTDIRLSTGYSPTLLLGRERRRLQSAPPMSQADMQDLVFALCDFSVYKHVEELRQGFLALKGAYRAGICGTAVIKDGSLETVKDITSITIRVPRLVYGAAEELRQKAGDLTRGLLIVGEPSSGKTTILRDLMVILSERRLAVLDERWELTGGFLKTDVDILYGYPKPDGITHAIRNLGAELILCDELDEGDLPAVRMAAASGVGLIATVHGDFNRGLRPFIKTLAETGAFTKIVALKGRDSPCGVEKIWEAGALLEAFGFHSADMRGNFCGTLQNSPHEQADSPPGNLS